MAKNRTYLIVVIKKMIFEAEGIDNCWLGIAVKSPMRCKISLQRRSSSLPPLPPFAHIPIASRTFCLLL